MRQVGSHRSLQVPEHAEGGLLLVLSALALASLAMILGSMLGVVALAVIGAGSFGWDGILRPVAALAPGSALIAATTEQLALVAIAGVIALKFAINVVFAVSRGLITP